jgi:hypothetical protein
VGDDGTRAHDPGLTRAGMFARLQRALRTAWREGSRCVLTCALALHLFASKAYAHMPEGSAALIFWLYIGGWSFLPLSATLTINRRLRTQVRASKARTLTWVIAVTMALVNVSMGAVLLHSLLADLDRPRLGPEPRVAWEVKATPMAIALSALQTALGLLAGAHVLWLARAAKRPSGSA